MREGAFNMNSPFVFVIGGCKGGKSGGEKSRLPNL